MNKKDLINVIAEQAQISKASAKLALDATLEAISSGLANGDKVSWIGFGTFSVAERGARQGVNPATKQAIEIPAKKVAKFKAGAELAEKVK